MDDASKVTPAAGFDTFAADLSPDGVGSADGSEPASLGTGVVLQAASKTVLKKVNTGVRKVISSLSAAAVSF
jgi:hypothetical protein